MSARDDYPKPSSYDPLYESMCNEIDRHRINDAEMTQAISAVHAALDQYDADVRATWPGSAAAACLAAIAKAVNR